MPRDVRPDQKADECLGSDSPATTISLNRAYDLMYQTIRQMHQNALVAEPLSTSVADSAGDAATSADS